MVLVLLLVISTAVILSQLVNRSDTRSWLMPTCFLKSTNLFKLSGTHHAATAELLLHANVNIEETSKHGSQIVDGSF